MTDNFKMAPANNFSNDDDCLTSSDEEPEYHSECHYLSFHDWALLLDVDPCDYGILAESMKELAEKEKTPRSTRKFMKELAEKEETQRSTRELKVKSMTHG